MSEKRTATCPRCGHEGYEFTTLPDEYGCGSCGCVWMEVPQHVNGRCVPPPDPLRDCDYLLSLPRLVPSKAWRN
jgi:hypothetical protein